MEEISALDGTSQGSMATDYDIGSVNAAAKASVGPRGAWFVRRCGSERPESNVCGRLQGVDVLCYGLVIIVWIVHTYGNVWEEGFVGVRNFLQRSATFVSFLLVESKF